MRFFCTVPEKKAKFTSEGDFSQPSSKRHSFAKVPYLFDLPPWALFKFLDFESERKCSTFSLQQNNKCRLSLIVRVNAVLNRTCCWQWLYWPYWRMSIQNALLLVIAWFRENRMLIKSVNLFGNIAFSIYNNCKIAVLLFKVLNNKQKCSKRKGKTTTKKANKQTNKPHWWWYHVLFSSTRRIFVGPKCRCVIFREKEISSYIFPQPRPPTCQPLVTVINITATMYKRQKRYVHDHVLCEGCEQPNKMQNEITKAR